MLECVVNVSEGRDLEIVAWITANAGSSLLDLHSDPDHHRSVLTLAGPEVEEAARAVAAAAVASIDLRSHMGVHPRLGALDVVPFVPLAGSTPQEALIARNRFAAWAGEKLSLPCFLYGRERSLPEVRRHAFRTLSPDVGPLEPHPSAGACAVGARPLLVAYNVWLAEASLVEAQAIAAELRGPSVRALGLAVAGGVQVSMNLIEPLNVGPEAVYDAIARRAPAARAELVGLVPEAVLDAIPRHRWAELDLDPTRTIEARLKWASQRETWQ